MELKTQKELAKAKEYFQQLRLSDCYSILRRYFDRLPFKPEEGHAEFIGMFIRVLSELGKKNELNFYKVELEKLEPKSANPSITYQLAMVCVNSEPPQLKTAIVLLEKLLKNGIAGDYSAKAKMTLAYCYDSISRDIATSRNLIFSIDHVEDKSLGYLLETWKAKVFRDEGNFVEAEKVIQKLLQALTAEECWYSYFTAKIISIGLYRSWGKLDLARKLLVETKALAKEKPLRTVQRQLDAIQESFVDEKPVGPIIFKMSRNEPVITYFDHSLELDLSRPNERLAEFFLVRKKLTKEEIIEGLFQRGYNPETDDPIIYYQVHAVKKLFKKLGVVDPRLSKNGLHYEFSGEVELIGEIQ